MKKHLLAAAVATAIAAPAMAQNVTVYGNLDMGYRSFDVKNFAYTAGANYDKSSMGAASRYSSSRLGVSASEDLGGGMKVGAVQEFALVVGDATGTLSSNRTSIISLSGSFGSVSLGRNKSQSQLIAEQYDVSGAVNAPGNLILTDNSDTFNASSDSVTADAAIIKGSTGDRIDNAVMYSSPVFSGFQFHGEYSNNANNDKDGTVGASNDKTQYQGVRVDFKTGPLAISVGTATKKVRAATATTYTKNDSDILGAKYVVGPVELFGQVASNKTVDTAGAQSAANSANVIGVGYNFGAYRVFAQMGSGDRESTAGNSTHDTKGQGMGVTYALSKRTTVYALYGQVEAKKKSTNVTESINETNFGINHKF